MSNFHLFQTAISKQFAILQQSTLFTSALTKDDSYDLYLKSFPKGSNEVFREKTTHDCNCCNQFIRAMGNVVAMVDGKLESIWDIDPTDVPEHYVTVAKKMAAEAKKGGIKGLFFHYTKKVGAKTTTDNYTDIVWDHFYAVLPSQVVEPEDDIPSLKGAAVNNHAVLKRSLTEITFDSIDTVIGLIDDDNLYRGIEFLPKLKMLKEAIEEFEAAGRADHFLWEKSIELGHNSGFRNSSIGKLLVDLEKGVDLVPAVKAFEKMVAPDNYQRPSPIVSVAQTKKANKRADELGIAPSIPRRHAVTSDLTINNVLHANRSAKESMGVFDAITPSSVKVNKGKATEIHIKDFISDVLPSAELIELLLDNNHEANLMSLIAPINSDAPGIFKWNNNFSFTYNGNIADAMKENVKKAGGKTDGVLRFSIQWNDNDDNSNDLDAHCIEPCGNRIYYPNKNRVHPSSGMLDVDIQRPNGVAVENIIFTDKTRMKPGKNQFLVQNYRGRNGRNFTAQAEFDGNIYNFSYEGKMREDEFVKVADVILKDGEFSIVTHLPCGTAPKEMWGLTTQQFHKVEMMMLSPNHWDGNATGNKHYFFILEGCLNPEKARGFYNEFLMPELHGDRKVFEHLGDKLKAPYSDNQCSGLGFSETVRNEVTAKVDNRLYTIKF